MKHEIDEFGEYGPAVIDHFRSKQQFQHGTRHRTDGPAIEYYDGAKGWYQYGKLHRLDGPAIEGGMSESWWIDGYLIDCEDNEEFLRIVKMKILL